MADYLPQNSGNWSTTTWITAFSNLTAFAGGNTPPTFVDDVYADGKTITININTGVNSIRTTTTPRTGGLAGGGFTLNNSISLSANVLAGTTTCLTFAGASPDTATLVGNVTGSSTSNVVGLLNSSTGSITVIGDARGGTAGNGINNNSSGTINFIGTTTGGSGGTGVVGFRNSSTGTVFVTGSVRGGPVGGSQGWGLQNASTGSVFVVGSITGGAGNIAAGFYNQTTGTVTISGSITGGTGSSTEGLSLAGASNVFINGSINGNLAPGIVNGSTATVSITGSVLGGNGSAGFGITNSSTGVINLSGTATGGIAAAGLNNTSTGTVFATRVVGNGFGLGSAGIGAIQVGLANSQNGRAYVEQVEFGPRGATPISGPVYILPSNQNTLTGYTTALGTPVTFYNSLSVSGLLPPTSSVRLGTVYNVGNSTGTMAVPSASAVQFGVAVDNTTGTAALQPQDVWGYARLSATQVNSLGDRLRNVATTQSVGQQIASFNL